jgi:hypothetical protein
MVCRTAFLVFCAIAIVPCRTSAQDLEIGATCRFNGTLVPYLVGAGDVITTRGQASTLNPLITYVGEFSQGASAVRHVKFHFVPYTDAALNAYWVGGVGTKKTFSVPFSEIAGRCARAYATGFKHGDFAIGALALPAKLRADPFNFSGTISLGPSLAYRWRMSPTRDYHLGAIASVGTTSVQLTPANTDSAVVETTDRAAYYFAAGLMAELGTTQIGLFLGKDLINTPNQEDWIYNNRYWFALGIGAALFGADGDRSAPTKQGN